MLATDKKAILQALEAIRTQATCPIEQAATALGISRSLAYKAAQSGEIETIRVGSRWVAITEPLRRKLRLSNATESAA